MLYCELGLVSCDDTLSIVSMIYKIDICLQIFLTFFLFYFFQLDLITDLLGTPSESAMRTSCEGARAHIKRMAHKQPSLAALYTLSNQATHEAVHLLCRMLVFDPVSIRQGYQIVMAVPLLKMSNNFNMKITSSDLISHHIILVIYWWLLTVF